MVDGLLNMRSRPYLSENLFDIPVDEGTRSAILPLAKRGGQRSIAFPQMALDAYQSYLAPYQAYSGELGMPSVDNPAFTDATTQFGVDFGLLPALGTAAIAKPSPNVLRSGAGGLLNDVPDDMARVLDLKAKEMELTPDKRTQPDAVQNYFDTSPEAYNRQYAEQAEISVPRVPEGVAMPQKNRAGKLAAVEDDVADIIAKRVAPFVGTNAQYFYNTAPIIDKAVDLGVPKKEAMSQLNKFADYYAATSPRTQTEPNLRSASLTYSKSKAGIPFDQVVGPNKDLMMSGGEVPMNEKGYPMILGPSGTHRMRLNEIESGEGISYKTNPKPYTFAENVKGNLTGVTADTHAIRGALDAMNERELGSIPDEFILKPFREMYKDDPTSFDPATMVDDQLKSQKIKGESVQTEYAVFSDLYKNVAKKLGVTPAEAQALAWFGTGNKTGLASPEKTLVDLISERVDVTSKALGQTKDEVFKKFLSGKIPLMSFVGGVTAAGTAGLLNETEPAMSPKQMYQAGII